jgi:hypothetical protein
VPSTTLAALTTACRAAIRDTVAVGVTNVFTDGEVQDMIGEGILELSYFYPVEIVESVTVTASTYTYTVPSDIDRIFRIDVMNSDGTIYDDDFWESQGFGTAGGWQIHGGKLYIPQRTDLKNGMTLMIWGYGPWTYIDSGSASSATTNLDQRAVTAVRKFVMFEMVDRLITDRVKFRQLQMQPESTDLSSIALEAYRRALKDGWERELTQLKTMRKMS